MTFFHLLPDKLGKFVLHASPFHERMRHVDVELERERELVVHEAAGNKDALRVTEVQVAMADGVIAERDIVAVGDDGLLALAHRERHEIVRLARERGGDRVGTAATMRSRSLSDSGDLPDGITDAVGCL